jgi:PTH1 family peptidyl-tRNA hydrolase
MYIVGLGNPGEEYKLTRHNMGRIVLDEFLKSHKMPEWQFDKKINSLKSEDKFKKGKVILLEPETYMNNSGKTVQKIITSKKKIKDLTVIHDDVDLPLGKFKIVFNRGAAGHKGVKSIIRAIKSQEFIRIRVGIAPATPSGKIKKPKGKKLLEFITGNFKPKELEIVKKTAKKITQALEILLEKGLQKAMNEWN